MTAQTTEPRVAALPRSGAVAPASAAALGGGEQVEWHGLALSVPRDWEIVRHGLSPALGSLCFVDRRRERLTLSWAAVKSVPDLGRIVHEWAGLACERGAPRPFDVGSWTGLMLQTAAGVETRVVSYDASTMRLLELRILARAGEERLARELIGGIRVRAEAEPVRRFRAFGIDVVVPRDFALRSAAVAPCDVSFRFERAAGGRETPLLRFSAQRLGMAGTWFDGDFAGLLAAKAPGVDHGPLQAVRVDGREAHACRGRCLEQRWVRLLGRAREERALLWSAPEQNAIQLLRSEGPSGRVIEPQEFLPRVRPGEGA
jgi:hypothetical protein